MADNTEDRVIALERELAELKRAVTPERHLTEREIAEWKDQWHQASERRMNKAYAWSREELEAMDKASGGTRAAQDIASRGGVRSPSSMIPSSPSTAASSGGVAPNQTGWAREQPIRPPSGVAYCDALMDMQDAKDRHERILEHAKMLAAQKLAEK
jgi:hypothetical protein